MRIGNINFGSIYRINYDYKKVSRHSSLYESKDSAVNDFVDFFSKNSKGKDDISAINPKTKNYYIKVDDARDSKLEDMAKEYGVEAQKADKDDMKGAFIASVGQSSDEQKAISDCIDKYESYLWYKREREELLDALPDMDD